LFCSSCGEPLSVNNDGNPKEQAASYSLPSSPSNTPSRFFGRRSKTILLAIVIGVVALIAIIVVVTLYSLPLVSLTSTSSQVTTTSGFSVSISQSVISASRSSTSLQATVTLTSVPSKYSIAIDSVEAGNFNVAVVDFTMVSSQSTQFGSGYNYNLTLSVLYSGGGQPGNAGLFSGVIGPNPSIVTNASSSSAATSTPQTGTIGTGLTPGERAYFSILISAPSNQFPVQIDLTDGTLCGGVYPNLCTGSTFLILPPLGFNAP